jgi:hypothetical protein
MLTRPTNCIARLQRAAGICLGALVIASASALPAAAADKPGFFSFSFGKSNEEQRAENTSAQLKELDQRLYAFADRYTTSSPIPILSPS